ncbi:MAG: hypothetical protein ACRD40_05985, partial [Candidatus Acidiferrales bacterium]
SGCFLEAFSAAAMVSNCKDQLRPQTILKATPFAVLCVFFGLQLPGRALATVCATEDLHILPIA